MCHAVPAHTGRTCGHTNTGGTYCRECGCTRHASDQRRQRSESDANRALLEVARAAGRNTDARDAERAAILRKLGV